MAAGTVGYTDTRGNKDYTSIIANQIGKRLREASDMASNERAYAAGMAEAGGTSLEEAGIGKGYFFGRALGSRFGGDRIARARGRMGMGGAGTNPTSNYKQRFRAGFDYNVTNKIANNNITDVAPLSNALAVGLRGVQDGLVTVGQAVGGLEVSTDKLANTQVDMAKAIMLNGYLFQMFMSQQRQQSGRSSLRREERSIEGRGYRGGGGFGFGGSGGGGGRGGRGMINITPRGGGGSAGGGGGFGGLSPRTNALTMLGTNIPLMRKAGQTLAKRSRGKGIYNAMMSGGLSGGVGSKVFNKIPSGDVVGLIGGGRGIYGSSGIELSQMALRNVGTGGSVATGLAKMVGMTSNQAANIGMQAAQYAGNAGFRNSYDMAAKKYGEIFTNATETQKKILMQNMLGKPDIFTKEFQAALANIEEANTLADLAKGKTSSILGPDGKPMIRRDPMALEALRMKDEVFEAVAKKYGADNAEKFMKLGLFGPEDAANLVMGSDGAITGLKSSATADSLMKHFPNFKYDNLEQAMVLARVGDMTDKGFSAKKQVDILTNKMGVNAHDLLLDRKIGDAILDSTDVGKIFAKGSSRTMWRRVGKMIPGVGLVLGTYFALQRLKNGDFLGAGLELTSGILGLGGPTTAGLGLGIDGFLLARDMGITPMATGGITDGAINALIGEKGREGVFPLEGTEGRKTFKLFGEGLVDGMVSKKKNYIALHDESLYGGLERAKTSGFFNTLNIEARLPRDAFRNIKLGLRQKHVDLKVPNDVKEFLKWFNNNKKTEGMSIVPDVGQQDLESLVLNSGQTTLTAKDNILYLQAIGKENESLALQTTGDGSTVATTVINNNYYNQGSTGGTGESRNEVLGQGYNSDLEKFIMNYSIMSK